MSAEASADQTRELRLEARRNYDHIVRAMETQSTQIATLKRQLRRGTIDEKDFNRGVQEANLQLEDILYENLSFSLSNHIFQIREILYPRLVRYV